MSQAALARALPLDRTAVSKIESGRRRVSSVELNAIGRTLNRPIQWFFSEPSPPADPLRTLRRNRARILRIAHKHGARSVRIFGSVARGEASAESDIDLLVEMETGEGLFAQGAMLVELQDLLGRDVDVVTVEGLRHRIRERVLREAVPL